MIISSVKKRKIVFGALGVLTLLGLVIPQQLSMPVQGADEHSYHPDSFWFYPWGTSGVHKGVDIFAREGTPVHSATIGLVVFTGKIKLGGNVVLVLGPKWRLHYYAHLKQTKVSVLTPVSKNTLVGEVGTSGNAAGKPAHLHYSIFSMIPLLWRIDGTQQGWKKMFYLNPIDFLK